MHVPLKMIDGHERLAQRLRQCFSVRNSNKQRPHQPRPLRHANRVHVGKLHSRLRERFAHHRHDLAQVFARGQLRHHAAIFPVNINLRSDHAGQNLAPVGDHCRRCLIARRFNSQNACAHQICALLSTISKSSSTRGSPRQAQDFARRFPRSLSEIRVCRLHRRKCRRKCTPRDRLPAPECAARR